MSVTYCFVFIGSHILSLILLNVVNRPIQPIYTQSRVSRNTFVSVLYMRLILGLTDLCSILCFYFCMYS